MTCGPASRNGQGNELFGDMVLIGLADVLGFGFEKKTVSRFYRGMFGVEILAIEGKADFQSEGVSGPQTCRFDVRMAHEPFPHVQGFVGVHVQFIAEFAGISGSADEDRCVFQGDLGESEISELVPGSRNDRGENVLGKGPLKIDFACGLGPVFKHDVPRKMRGEPFEITVDARTVDHDHEVVFSQSVDDQIIEDAAELVEDESIPALPGDQGFQVVGDDGAKGFGRPGSGDGEFSHMANVEQRCLGSGLFMFAQYAGVLYRHFPSGKGYQLAAVVLVPLGEGRGQKVRGYLIHG